MSYAHGPEGLSADDMERAARNSQTRDLAIRWWVDNEAAIAGLAGKESRSDGRAIAQIVVAAEIVAKMYGDLHKEFGAPTAQATLKTFFSHVGGVMRRNGQDVLLRVVAEFDKVTAVEPDVPYAAAPRDELCLCELDQDGRCGECVETLRSFCSKIGESVKIIREAGLDEKKACRPCIRRHLDYAMAEFVRRDLASVSLDAAEAMMKTAFVTSQSLQAMPMPLTMKAWDELLKGRGSV